MHVPLLDLKAQYETLREEFRAAVDAVCEDQVFILGPRVADFERDVAAYVGTAGAVGVSSGTDALLVSLMAMNIGPGDAVVTTPYTFFATVGTIARCGATPVFADIDPVSFNLAPEAVEDLMASFSIRFPGLTLRAMIPVHLYGQCADMKALLEIANRYNIRVIEDAAQAIGTEFSVGTEVRKAGAMGDLGCLSFFPSKNLGGFGDGGMVVSNDDELLDRCRKLRVHGGSPKYYHALVGGNFRLDALQAAVLAVKLKHLDAWHDARRQHAARYDEAFSGTSVQAPQAVHESGCDRGHIYNQYVIRVRDRDRVRTGLKERDIGSEIYYPVPLHLQECFQGLGYEAGEFPESERAAAETLALPVYPELTCDMQDYVIESLLDLV